MKNQFPIQFYPSNNRTINAPKGFDGVWLHSTNPKTKESILSNGWRPDLIRNTMYGTAIYLAQEKWFGKEVSIKCRLNLLPNEVIDFAIEGLSQDDVILDLKDKNINASRTPRKGSNQVNLEIQNYFLSKNIKAIKFLEHGTPVIAVYDPRCIYVMI